MYALVGFVVLNIKRNTQKYIAHIIWNTHGSSDAIDNLPHVYYFGMCAYNFSNSISDDMCPYGSIYIDVRVVASMLLSGMVDHPDSEPKSGRLQSIRFAHNLRHTSKLNPHNIFYFQ